jgi:hypothetical protein
VAEDADLRLPIFDFQFSVRVRDHYPQVAPCRVRQLQIENGELKIGNLKFGRVV